MNIDNSNTVKNARISSRNDYTRWLSQRFGSINLMTTQEGQDRVNLSKIYVPIRLDSEDRDEKSIGSPDAVDDESLLGVDARDIISKQQITIISGRPGSGKTTLTQALIHELCVQRKSEFRNQLIENIYSFNQTLNIEKSNSILPIPLILRNYQQELMSIDSFDELISLWWEKAYEEVQDKSRYAKHNLNIEHLKHSIHPQGDDIPLLIIFDGIDEVGGRKQRQAVMRFVDQALRLGHRVVLTGRPTGLNDLTHKNLADFWGDWPLIVSYVQPFVWQEINYFIEQIYRVSDEWKNLREQGIQEFNEALRDPQRDYLLNLARRPIFLTLMSLVHINDTAMPHGRANLYERIIDLYLVRQTQHKRLVHTKEGKTIPKWDDKEVRRALGYLAWRSQVRSDTLVKKNDFREIERQVIWSKQDMLLELEGLLTEQKAAFQHIQVEDASDLLSYYLHPAGLLIEPAEQQIQFSHLSFQEYLCAEYLHGQCTSKGFKWFIHEVKLQVLDHLEKPGWDEIALLFLTIHSSQGQQSQATAHFEILAELEIEKLSHAKLLLAAYTGQELRFTEEQRLDWLPLIFMTCLLYPHEEISNKLQQLTKISDSFQELLVGVLDAKNAYEYLINKAVNSLPEGFYCDDDISTHLKTAKEAWDTPINRKHLIIDNNPNKFRGLSLDDLQLDARNSSLFSLIDSCNWFFNDNESSSDKLITEHILKWLESNPLTTMRFEDNVPRLTSTVCSLSLIGYHSEKITYALNKTQPLDWMLMYREVIGVSDYAIDILKQGIIKSDIHNNRLKLYDFFISFNNLVGFLAKGSYVKVIRKQTKAIMKSLNGIDINENKVRGSRERSRFSRDFMEKRNKELLSVSLAEIFDSTLSGGHHRIDKSLTKHLEKHLKSTRNLELINKAINSKEAMKHSSLDAYILFAIHCRSIDWFNANKASPDISLPEYSCFFDSEGTPLRKQSRDSWIELHNWFDNKQNILDFVFPMGLSKDDDVLLQGELQIYNQQPWSATRVISSILEEWEESELIKEINTDDITNFLLKESQKIMNKESRAKRSKKKAP